MKKPPEDIIALHLHITNDDHMMCMVPEMWSATDRIFCHFGLFFCPFSPLTAQKIKMKKNTWR